MAFTQIKNRKQAEPASEDEVEDSDQSSDESEAAEGNAGWANSIAKVLNTTKPKSKKSLVLSRAKKTKPTGKTTEAVKDCGFEIEGADGIVKVKEEKPIKEELDEKIGKRKNLPLQLRNKPSWKDVERERTLRKVATRGVVQLFNAVRMQQKDLHQQLEAAGPLDSRKETVLNNIDKRKFLDVLMCGKRSKSEAVDNNVKSEVKAENSSDDGSSDEDVASKPKSEWNVLRSDYMTNKKIKHWDEDDEADNSDQNAETDDDSGDEK